MKVSDCCGAPPRGDAEDMGICCDCREHCEYVEEDWEEGDNEPQDCPNCGREYDEIDQEFLICSYCGYNANNKAGGKTG